MRVYGPMMSGKIGARPARKTSACVRVSHGESLRIEGEDHSIKQMSCDDIARMALAMYEHGHFFSMRRGLSFDFRRDLNGSGSQGLYIKRTAKDLRIPVLDGSDRLMQIFFDVPSTKDRELLYEADLTQDGRKDYEPSINKGKRWFAATRADLMIDGNGEEFGVWLADLDRLLRMPGNLSEWIERDLQMFVACKSLYCREPAILTKDDLRILFEKGLELNDLASRFRCSKCGQRDARIKVF